MTAFRDKSPLPSWAVKRHALTYHINIEIFTEIALASAPSAKEKDFLDRFGVLPDEPLARGRVCVMCPTRAGGAHLLPSALRYNWRHIPCGYQSDMGRIYPCHVKIVDPKRKIMTMSHPSFEDSVILPIRTVSPQDRVQA